jgi:hypothetical protein
VQLRVGGQGEVNALAQLGREREFQGSPTLPSTLGLNRLILSFRAAQWCSGECSETERLTQEGDGANAMNSARQHNSDHQNNLAIASDEYCRYLTLISYWMSISIQTYLVDLFSEFNYS